MKRNLHSGYFGETAFPSSFPISQIGTFMGGLLALLSHFFFLLRTEGLNVLHRYMFTSLVLYIHIGT